MQEFRQRKDKSNQLPGFSDWTNSASLLCFTEERKLTAQNERKYDNGSDKKAKDKNNKKQIKVIVIFSIL